MFTRIAQKTEEPRLRLRRGAVVGRRAFRDLCGATACWRLRAAKSRQHLSGRPQGIPTACSRATASIPRDGAQHDLVASRGRAEASAIYWSRWAAQDRRGASGHSGTILTAHPIRPPVTRLGLFEKLAEQRVSAGAESASDPPKKLVLGEARHHG